ncbi:acyl-ACP--UDP-N-acetylglucosamine O-acyltransferase [Xylanibacter rodentium]|jgi:UDP-N-acetylglucosamine acyltransferase|uniref:Acyl-ACP--UDP-N-acetylglucosamine O-acyltransferase n=1 Tax=Xylanibacter rodentium TaxID=2736289 RepID=A0ABX2AYQ9_9BACT|nr:acyl-ACP--UDP-N-acetylglucosamine O-acyltransferase [Xylanibacter rodentium]NPE11849.1 acyl-ACP--UDP-N-acetylglucosamine O-acyltransferase [Prevotella sp. PJ1A]NPE14791.1 acyl-ACP--UDP-N-acetylglucosamine O-acyltransferase [Xylanibacter rodentium]NPE39708.1 acyl-ACP--UDP-N-acetylglucosamine O-acyltransferase [Prevotella sp. PCJ2]
MISEKAEISPKAKIGKNVTIYPFAYIEDDVEIGDNCVIFPYVSIMKGTRLGRNNKVFQNTVLGAMPQDFYYKGDDTSLIIGDDNTIRENVVINRATFSSGQTVIGNRNFLMEGVHISHDTKITDACVFGYGVKIAGDCEINNRVILSSSVIINPKVRIGTSAMISSGCRISKDVPPYIVACGNPVQYGGVNKLTLENHKVSEKVQGHIANAYRLVFHGQTSVFDAVKQIEQQVPDGDEVRTIIKFIQGTQLGIIGKM